MLFPDSIKLALSESKRLLDDANLLVEGEADKTSLPLLNEKVSEVNARLAKLYAEIRKVKSEVYALKSPKTDS